MDSFVRYLTNTILPIIVAIVPFFSWQILKIFELEKRVEILEIKHTQINEIKLDLRELKEKIEMIRIKLGS